MLDICDYTTGNNGHQGNGNNGYDHLEGEWLTYHNIGKNFVHKVKRQDREDFLHDLFIAFAQVKTNYDSKGKELTEGGLVRIAQYQVANYWRKWYRYYKNSDCGNCSKGQRRLCKENNAYGNNCPKAIHIDSLDRLIEDNNGDSTPLHEMIADEKSVDLVARLDAKLIIDGYPQRFIQIAYKQYAGYPLTDNERAYLYRQKKKAQKVLF